MTTYYDVHILEGTGGCATGINDSGLIVGYTEQLSKNPVSGWWVPNPSSGLVPSYSFKSGPAGMLVGGVDNMGDVILPSETLFNIPFNSSPSSSPLPFVDASALNNRHVVVGGNVVYDWLNLKVLAKIAFPGIGGIAAFAINGPGDVVGVAGIAGEAGGTLAFFYPASAYNTPGIGAATYLGENVRLYDINDNKIGVGAFSNGEGAAYADFSQVPPQWTEVLLPYNSEDFPATATAINSAGTIVGTAGGAPGPQSEYAFFLPPGQTSGFDLNEHSGKAAGWSLVFASDINDAGYIVGQAQGPNGSAAFVAAPRVTLRGSSFPLLGLIREILQGLLLEEGLVQGGGIRSPRPATWNSLPVQRREIWLRLAISNLAGLMSDSEARSQIQNVIAQTASSDQSTRGAKSGISQSEQEQIAKTLKRMGRK